jgi:hypothetical protein
MIACLNVQPVPSGTCRLNSRIVTPGPMIQNECSLLSMDLSRMYNAVEFGRSVTSALRSPRYFLSSLSLPMLRKSPLSDRILPHEHCADCFQDPGFPL